MKVLEGLEPPFDHKTPIDPIPVYLDKRSEQKVESHVCENIFEGDVDPEIGEVGEVGCTKKETREVPGPDPIPRTILPRRFDGDIQRLEVD